MHVTKAFPFDQESRLVIRGGVGRLLAIKAGSSGLSVIWAGSGCKLYELHAICMSPMQIARASCKLYELHAICTSSRTTSCNLHELSHNLYELHAICTSFVQIARALAQFVRASCKLHELHANCMSSCVVCTSSRTVCTSFMQFIRALVQIAREVIGHRGGF